MLNEIPSSNILFLPIYCWLFFCLSSWYVHWEEPLALQICPLRSTLSGQWLHKSCRGQQRSAPPLKFDLWRGLPAQLVSGTSVFGGWGGGWGQSRTEPAPRCSSPKLLFMCAQQARPQRLHREPLLPVRGTSLALRLPPQSTIQSGTLTPPVLSIYRGAPHDSLCQGSLPDPQTHPELYKGPGSHNSKVTDPQSSIFLFFYLFILSWSVK